MNDKPLDFQSIIMTLQHFWTDRGCLIWQPYYLQVGAGTMNPGTFLRVLGPEPWNVAYVEPSIRPDDGRYGENPNRMQQHYQFQVILKPDPGNPQEIYLESLVALGIDPLKHDIRFVEDNWEQPALGAWGLGWEVWLDGQEITQFTYFQQAGGINLNPVSVELTYGLDRIAIALQRARGFQDILWNDVPSGAPLAQPRLTAGDINLQAEREHSRYYFEIADIQRLREMYDLFEAEGIAALGQGLILPAYDYLLKCSHTFNILDTRGAIGVTERQAYFGRMRELARKTAEAYLEQRQRLEFPWLNDGRFSEILNATARVGEGQKATNPPLPGPASFLLEIGTEELPPGDLESALEQLRQRVPALLTELRLVHGAVRVLGTPRRLIVYVDDLAPRQTDQETIVKGPPFSRAYDASGLPTPAAEGFARSKGVPVSQLQKRFIDGGEYVVAVIRESGRMAGEVLAEAIPELIATLKFEKSMRWNSSNVAFSRPIRWLCALHGNQVVPFEYAGLTSGRITRGLRFSGVQEITLSNSADYFRQIEAQGIVLAVEERREVIEEQVRTLAALVQGETEPEPDLVLEVADLVEAPRGLLGSFDASYLNLPGEILITVMKNHQRYFPVQREGKLLPFFITISNCGAPGYDQELPLVIEGNEQVIRARFSDAAFFVEEDLKQPLEAYLPRLGTLIFQTRLGSMLDKAHRLEVIVGELAPLLGLSPEETAAARRAAQLCKADLVTRMVIEITALQGVMGRYYALRSGETKAVADAIYEHYLPRYAGDATPKSLPGLIVGIADRLDTLCGLFAIGMAPTGAKDPFGQRRAALGLVAALIAWDLDFELRPALQAVARQLPVTLAAETLEVCLRFIGERLRNLLLEQGFRYDVVDAILAVQGENPARALQAVKSLSSWVARQDWDEILPAYARCVRITRDVKRRFPVKEELLVEPAEKVLFASLQTAEESQRAHGSVDDFFNAFLPMIPPINKFFDDVLVMTEDISLQQNRLGLLQRIAAMANGVVDLSRLEGF